MSDNTMMRRLLGAPIPLLALAALGILWARATVAEAQCGNGRLDSG